VKKKLALSLVTLVGVLCLLVPATSSAAPTCVRRDVGMVHIQIGYCRR
jgi:hypothetical protein